jgi:beta-mannanase
VAEKGRVLKQEREEAALIGEQRRNMLAGGMSRRDFLRLSSVGLAGAALSSVLPGILSPGSIATASAAATNVALGVFTPKLPWDFQDIDSFSTLVGRKPRITHWFQDWATPTHMEFEPSYMDAAAISREAMPLVTWEPWKTNEGPEQPDYALKTIIEGNHDDYIRQWAKAAAAWGKPFLLRFAHEMNSDWTSWSPGINGNTSSQFVAAWRRVHNIFSKIGATNAKWVWSPVAHYQGATPYKRVYPGNAYVDWVGISGYNWGDTKSWSRWQSFSEIFGESYRILGQITNKPVIIPEVACAESGGDKAAWIRKAFLEEIPNQFPRIRAVAWFHVNKENDWRVDSSSDSLEAYKEVAANSSYQGILS